MNQHVNFSMNRMTIAFYFIISVLFCATKQVFSYQSLVASLSKRGASPRRASSIFNSLGDKEEGSFTKPQRKHKALRMNPVPNKSFARTMQLQRPVGIIHQYDDSTYQRVKSRTQLQISTGLTFDDGDQLLVSAQKPLGMVLEERDEKGCIVVSVEKGGAACRAGVKEGDLLVAVQNADVGRADFEEVMGRIIDAPKVVNLRFWRLER